MHVGIVTAETSGLLLSDERRTIVAVCIFLDGGWVLMHIPEDGSVT